jgi:hypothetical protein
MATDFQTTVTSFATNVHEVERLLDFDRLIIDVAVDALRQLERELDERHLHSVLPIVKNRASALSNVQDNESLRPQYQAMFNQCVVLLVSYFGSAVHTLFRQGVSAALAADADVPAAGEELKVSWRAVAQVEGDREAMFADLLIAQHDISFQDMQSISRAFKRELGLEIVRSEETNDIILGQAARHVIVHSGGLVDKQMLRQIGGATPRKLKQHVEANTPVRFTPPEVRLLATSMISYLKAVSHRLAAAERHWTSRRQG